MSLYVGGIKVSLPIGLGGGACKIPESIVPYMRPDVPAGFGECGSFTFAERLGNEGNPLFYPPDRDGFELERKKGFFNALGLPNCGIEKADQRLTAIAESLLKPTLVNVAGSSVDEYVACIRQIMLRSYVHGIVINTSCMNTGKMPFGYSLESMRELLVAIRNTGVRKPIWLKLPPYILEGYRLRLNSTYPDIDFTNAPSVDREFMAKMAELINEFTDIVRAVISSNTLGNCIKWVDGKPATAPNDGKAGLSGPIIKTINMELARTFLLSLDKKIDWVACGGVLHGDDGADYLDAGFTAFEATSAPFWYGNHPERFFSDLVSESERLQDHLKIHCSEEEA